MVLDIFISTEEELNKLNEKTKENNKLTNYGRNKVKFKCSVCNKERTKAIHSINFPFICANCCNSKAQQSKEVKDKIKKTCKEKYGYEYTAQVPSIRKAQLKTYEKHKKEDKNFVSNIVKKRMKTYKDKTGYENPNQNPVVQKQIAQTCKEKYGTEYAILSADVQKQIRDTKLERYGDEYYTNRDKSAKTFNEHFKDEEFRKEINKKKKDTNNKKYNCDWSLQNDKIKEKSKATWQTTLGVSHPSKSLEIRSKQRKKYKYNDICFDSSWELAYYIWLKDNNVRFEYHTVTLKYFWENEEHTYFVDFKVFNTLVEIKSPLLYEKMLLKNSIDNAKLQCMNQHNIKIITDCSKYVEYIKNKYGPKYLKSFKNN